jgi:hypothetical protein
MSHRKKEEQGKKLRRRSCGKTEIDGEASLLDDPMKWKCLRKKKIHNEK